MKVRQYTGLCETEAAKHFNKLINRLVQKAVANRAVDYEDSICLHDDYANVVRVAHSKLEAKGDMKRVILLGALIAVLYNSSHIARLILSYPMADDERDANYSLSSDVADSHKNKRRRLC
jgi:hypothetical protein